RNVVASGFVPDEIQFHRLRSFMMREPPLISVRAYRPFSLQCLDKAATALSQEGSWFVFVNVVGNSSVEWVVVSITLCFQFLEIVITEFLMLSFGVVVAVRVFHIASAFTELVQQAAHFSFSMIASP
ncbi:hypothetical protein, partial [Streptomyces sp. P17]|uniref:hypothetical protein n=1 Tax=Streptomyces sp. P17 TaxID=3074716 RepID=UPI0028F41016